MLHGALNDPAKCPRPFFYFRDVAFLSRVPQDQRRTYCDMGAEVEEKLHALKVAIVKAGFRVRPAYPPPALSSSPVTSKRRV
jgi:hypothetical protein